MFVSFPRLGRFSATISSDKFFPLIILMESFQEQDGHYPSLLVVVPEQVQVVFSLVLKGLGIVCSFAFVTCCVATWHQSEVIFSDFEPQGSFGTGIHGYRCD